MQVGRGTVSLADAYTHLYQESKVSLVTPAGKHAGEVDLFFVFASKEVSLLWLASCPPAIWGALRHLLLCN